MNIRLQGTIFHALKTCLATMLFCFPMRIAAQSADEPSFTLRTQARAVLIDVTVTDANGRPVHKLSRSAFHVFDNKQPQDIASLDEHLDADRSARPVATSAEARAFGNDFLLHPPPVFNVIVLDTATIGVVDQMYLNGQLEDFINALPPQNALAIYVHSGGFTLLLQNFTADHAMLLAAIHKAIPVIPMPGAESQTSLTAMHQIALYLRQLPGRKNVLWYCASPDLPLMSDASRISSLSANGLRATYDELEASRIALYPIDVRGVVPGDPPFLARQEMTEEAKATGGFAYFDNDLLHFSLKTIATDADFYTLSYSPRDYRQDNRWHNVKVTVDGGPYTLSYRTGYYGDGIESEDPNETKKARTLLTATGEKLDRPANTNQPIIFHAELIQPSPSTIPAGTPTAPVRHGINLYTIRYTVSAADFVKEPIPGGQRVQIGAGLIAQNQNGRPVTRLTQKFVLGFLGERLTQSPHVNLSFDQQVSLPKGMVYLSTTVWDVLGGRLGTIQMPATLAGHAKSSHERDSRIGH